MIVTFYGETGVKRLKSIMDGAIEGGAWCAVAGEKTVRGKTNFDMPQQQGIVISALHLPFSLTFQSSWTTWDRNGFTAEAVTRVVAGLGAVAEQRPDWWAVIGGRGRLPSIVPQLGRARTWVYAGDARYGVWGDFIKFGAVAAPLANLQNLVEWLVRAQAKSG